MSTTEAVKHRQTTRVQEAIEENSIETEDGDQLVAIHIVGKAPIVDLQIGETDADGEMDSNQLLADHFGIDGEAVTDALLPELNKNYISNNRVAELRVDPETGLATEIRAYPHLIKTDSMSISESASNDIIGAANKP